MKKLYNFRLDVDLVKAVDRLEGSRTGVVTSALQSYLRCSDNSFTNSYDVNILQVLHDQVQDLKQDKHILQDQVQVLMVSSIPLLGRLKMRLLR